MANNQWTVKIINVSGIDQFVDDIGITIDATADINLDDLFTYCDLTESKDLKDLITSGDLILNDGINNLSASESLDYLNVVHKNYLKENYYTKTYLDTQLIDKNTLDEAYNEGGSGNGRIIDATAGAVVIDTLTSTNSPIELVEKATLPITNLNSGQLTVKDGMLFIYDGNRNKWLSTSRMILSFGRRGRTTNQFLSFYGGNVSSNRSGLRLQRDATIVALSGQFDSISNGIFHIGKNDNFTSIVSLNVSSSLGNHDNSINIDLNEGDFLQSYIQAVQVICPMLLVEIAWRS